MKRIHRSYPLFALCLLASPAGAGDMVYREAVPGYHFQFPADHFEHEDFRTEWWYYTGNVTDARGERFGFELVFFRQGTSRGSGPARGPVSAWSVDDVYLAHAALTDSAGKKFRYEERLNRGGPGLAGASFDQQRIWNGNWSSRWKGEQQTLDAVTDQFRFHLELDPEKPFVRQGEDGLSQKSDGRGRASYYVSFPRLRVKGSLITGSIRTGRVAHEVQGSAWMDHEWFTGQLGPHQIGWNWFSVQLDDGTELMLLELRRDDGTKDTHSAGTFVGRNGAVVRLRQQDFTLQPLSTWRKYPVEWRISVPALKIDLVCRAVLPDQELRPKFGGPVYWEGAVDYAGSQKGKGYLEMTGYYGEAGLR